MDKITTTIEREYLREIVAGRKRIEYREIKPYWTKRFDRVTVPFLLRLRNGMTPPVPEVTVEIKKIVRNTRGGTYNLHIGRIVGTKNWDKRREAPRSARRS